ncbi:MAG: Rieske (2Fe-2S) protein [Actinomycetota bacterium]
MGIIRRLLGRRVYQPELPGIDVPRSRGLARKADSNGQKGSPLAIRSVTTPLSRRTFLSGTLAWVSAGIASIVGAPVATALVWPALQKPKGAWNPIARLGKPGPGEPDLSAVGTPIITHFTALVQDAYMSVEPQNIPIMVMNHGQEKFTILDVRCTHLGCPVAPDLKTKKIVCPCHTGIFDFEGRVKSGPPSRPLDRYEYKVEDGVLYAGKLYRVDADLRRVT